MQIEFFSMGAAQEVTGSKHFVKKEDTTIMIDSGAFQRKTEIAEKKNREWQYDPAKIDAVILTHAHYDHSGLIPLLVKRGFTGNIYATPATRVSSATSSIRSPGILSCSERTRRS